MPVMEGKAMLFKEFGGVDAWPICLATKDVDEIVAPCAAIAPGFGGINLEDISAPRCFEIERRLRDELDIPVFHDDQHGTAVVVLAAFLNALRVVGKRPEDVRVVIIGVGAAGVAVHRHAARRRRARHRRLRPQGRDPRAAATTSARSKARLRRAHEPARLQRHAPTRRSRARTCFIGLSGPGAVTPRGGRARWADDAIVFAMANPTPEVAPEEIEGHVAVIATGRSDYPNQINNVLAFPGIFRGALDVRATRDQRGDEARCRRRRSRRSSRPTSSSPDYIIPSVFNRDVAPAVAAAVAQAALESGVARRDGSGATADAELYG